VILVKYLSKNVLLVAGAAALVVLLLVLRPTRAVPALPLALALLAICPLSMMFMMRGMSGHGQEEQSPAAGADVSRQVADLQEEVRILRAAGTRPDAMPQAPAGGTTSDGLA
jgi:Protein of unknown function (DUF2933)